MKKEKKRTIRIVRNPLLPLLAIGLMVGLYALPHRTMMRIFYMVVMALILNCIYMRVIKNKISFGVEDLKEQVAKGESVKLSINIKNTSFLPSPYIYILFKESDYLVTEQVRGLCVILQGHEEKSYQVDYIGTLSGEACVGIEQIILVDYFELIRKKLKFSWEQHVMVTPQLIGIANEQNLDYFASSKEEAWQDSSSHTEGEIGYDLSPYREGQSPRLMHWKLVAQRDIYMVREREMPKEKKENRLIILDPLMKQVKYNPSFWQKVIKYKKNQYERNLSKRRAELVDYRITACISYLNEVIAQGENIKFLYCLEGSWREIELKRVEDLESVQEQIQRALINQEPPKEGRWANLNGQTFENQVLISACVDEELINYLEGQSNLMLLALQRSQMKYRGNRYAYISKDYKIQQSI